MKTDIIQIDGSQGEGGGQVFRTSLALSMVTGRPVTISNIRAGRRKPGLMRQHLTALSAAERISGAHVSGGEIGSTRVTFTPGPVSGGDYHFAVGTAGSATLVFQTVLPALLAADAPSTLVLEGGTHNPFAPTVDFIDKAFLPILRRMGVDAKISLIQHGFYPAGGGKFEICLTPGLLTPVRLGNRGEITHRRAMAKVAKIPGSVGMRELKVAKEKLGWQESELIMETVQNSIGPGNVFAIELGGDDFFEVFTGFGEKGVAAEKVASTTVKAAREFMTETVPVGRYLADQLLIPMALAGGGRFLTLSPSRHTETNVDVIRAFLDIPITVTRTGKKVWEICLGADEDIN